MKTSVILNFVLAVAVVALGIKAVQNSNGGDAAKPDAAKESTEKKGSLQSFDIKKALVCARSQSSPATDCCSAQATAHRPTP